MATKQQSDLDAEAKSMARHALNAIIGKNLIQSLGSPADMLTVKVNPVGRETYRVNVMVGKDICSSRVADSFFLTADEEGNIVTCSPQIVRLY